MKSMITQKSRIHQLAEWLDGFEFGLRLKLVRNGIWLRPPSRYSNLGNESSNTLTLLLNILGSKRRLLLAMSVMWR